MTAAVSYTLFDQDREVVTGSFTSDTVNAWGYDGNLPQNILAAPLPVEKTLYISAACRTGAMDVLITYTVLGLQTYRVKPGAPLIMETIPADPNTGELIISIEFRPVPANASDVSIVLAGATVSPPIPPLDSFLLLTPDAGVTVDSQNRVTVWQDVRAGAPAQFDQVTTTSPVLELDEDLGGNVLRFGGDNGALFGSGLESSDAATVWEFLNDGSPFTLCMVGRFTDGQNEIVISTDDGQGGAGVEIGTEPAFRAQCLIKDAGGTDLVGAFFDQEFPPVDGTSVRNRESKPTVLMMTFDGTDLVIESMNISKTITVAGPFGATPAETMKIGRRAGGNPGGGDMRGRIADLRIWQRALTEGERANYQSWAAARFTLELTPPRMLPVLENIRGHFRGSRGNPTGTNVTVTQLWDSRTEYQGDNFVLTAASTSAPLAFSSEVGGRGCYDLRKEEFDPSYEYDGAPDFWGRLAHQDMDAALCILVIYDDSSQGIGPFITNEDVGADPTFALRAGALTDPRNLSYRVSAQGSPELQHTAAINTGDVVGIILSMQPGSMGLTYRKFNDVNDDEVVTSTSLGGPPAAAVTAAMHIGAPDGFGHRECRIADLVIYDTPRSTAGQRLNVYRYWAERYNLPFEE